MWHEPVEKSRKKDIGKKQNEWNENKKENNNH